jgi:hypothetical protein
MNLSSGSGPYVFAIGKSSDNLTLTWSSGANIVTYFSKGYNTSCAGELCLAETAKLPHCGASRATATGETSWVRIGMGEEGKDLLGEELEWAAVGKEFV